MLWRWLVVAFVAVIGLLGIVYSLAMRWTDRPTGGAVMPAVEPTPVVNCDAGTRDIGSSAVSTGLANARLERGDSDVNSNDWTRIELAYRLGRDSTDRTLRLALSWSVQEANADRSLASTRIRNERVIDLYRIAEECPGLVLTDLGTLANPDTTREYWVEGQQHDFVPLPDFGALSGIQVRFDGPGTGDQQWQLLQATLAPFTVTVGTKP